MVITTSTSCANTGHQQQWLPALQVSISESIVQLDSYSERQGQLKLGAGPLTESLVSTLFLCRFSELGKKTGIRSLSFKGM